MQQAVDRQLQDNHDGTTSTTCVPSWRVRRNASQFYWGTPRYEARAESQAARTAMHAQQPYRG